MKISANRTRQAFTLVEMMAVVGCGSIILAAVVTASVALQRNFAAVEGYSIAQGNQLRILDYLAMDSRRAYSVAIPTDPTAGVPIPHKIIFTLPNYYDSNGNPSPAKQDSSDPNNQSVYYDGNGSGTQTVTITYFQSGTSIMRQVGNNTAVAIATNVYSFDPHDISTNVTCSVTFLPTFRSSSGSHTWWGGNGAPSNSVGVNGDYYMDDSTNTMYLKSEGAYAPDANTVYCNLFLRNPRARQ